MLPVPEMTGMGEAEVTAAIVPDNDLLALTIAGLHLHLDVRLRELDPLLALSLVEGKRGSGKSKNSCRCQSNGKFLHELLQKDASITAAFARTNASARFRFPAVSK